MKLYGHPDSGHALKVKFYLDWLDADYEYQWIDIFADPSTRPVEFLTASKFAEVPTLIDDGQRYIQSNAILVYLADKFGQFSDNEQRQRCLEWLVWEANKIGMCLPQLRAHEKLSSSYPSFTLTSGARDWLLARYQHDVNVLDRELAEQAFILGDILSIADFSLAGYLLLAEEAGVEVPANVVRWLGRLREQRGWQDPQQMLKA